MITLERFAYSPKGTFGRLVVENRFECFTVERPWLDNRVDESCIPEGDYRLKLRESGVVKRSSGGVFTKGWEVTNVPGRTLIMIHPGNTMADVVGCIAVGKSLGDYWSVTDSRETFAAFMAALEGLDAWSLKIHTLHAGKLPSRAFA